MEKEKIIELFSSGRCPICALLRQDEFDYLCHWVGVSDEKYKNSEERKRLLELSGFCNYHFWEYEQVGTKYGSAEICIGLIEKTINNLQDQKSRIGANCPVCNDLKVNESEHIKELAYLLSSSRNRTKYAEGVGLCIPHLIKTLAYTNDDSLTPFLLETAKKQLERVKMNAVELIRKKDAPLRWEQTDDEKNSYFRAIEKLAGRRGTKYE
jgi:hypothetical protein